MFNWKIEDMILYNQKGGTILGKEKIYDCEHKVSREDKIAFVDSQQDGRLSYLLSLIEKFNNEMDSMPRDQWDNIKTVSLKAWIKRNDTKYAPRTLIDSDYHYGKYNLLGTERYIGSERKGTYDTYEDFVDEMFHRQLKECEREEQKYFLEHDEYSILKQKFRDKKYRTTFGVHISVWSSGRICVCDENGNERDITIDELKYLLSKYDELDRLVEKITTETNIKY